MADLDLAYNLGASYRRYENDFATASEEVKAFYFTQEQHDAFLRGYRGHIEYPQHIGSGSHLWTVSTGAGEACRE